MNCRGKWRPCRTNSAENQVIFTYGTLELLSEIPVKANMVFLTNFILNIDPLLSLMRHALMSDWEKTNFSKLIKAEYAVFSLNQFKETDCWQPFYCEKKSYEFNIEMFIFILSISYNNKKYERKFLQHSNFSLMV